MACEDADRVAQCAGRVAGSERAEAEIRTAKREVSLKVSFRIRAE